jgi:hypothetical protein
MICIVYPKDHPVYAFEHVDIVSICFWAFAMGVWLYATDWFIQVRAL